MGGGVGDAGDSTMQRWISRQSPSRRRWIAAAWALAVPVLLAAAARRAVAALSRERTGPRLVRNHLLPDRAVEHPGNRRRRVHLSPARRGRVHAARRRAAGAGRNGGRRRGERGPARRALGECRARLAHDGRDSGRHDLARPAPCRAGIAREFLRLHLRRRVLRRGAIARGGGPRRRGAPDAGGGAPRQSSSSANTCRISSTSHSARRRSPGWR